MWTPIKKIHLVPNEVLIPQDIDEEAVKALVILRLQTSAVRKQLVNEVIKNARVSLEQFNLLENLSKRHKRAGRKSRSFAPNTDPSPY